MRLAKVFIRYQDVNAFVARNADKHNFAVDQLRIAMTTIPAGQSGGYLTAQYAMIYQADEVLE